MNPLKTLSDVQKARLLHALFYHQIPAYLDFTRKRCKTVIAAGGINSRQQEPAIVIPEIWLALAEEIGFVLVTNGKYLEKSGSVFSEQLFTGHRSKFMKDQLLKYAAQERVDPKFRDAILLFFDVSGG